MIRETLEQIRQELLPAYGELASLIPDPDKAIVKIAEFQRVVHLLDEALTSLDAPFDISNFPEWVVEEVGFSYRLVKKNHTYKLYNLDDGEYQIEVGTGKSSTRVFIGHIRTHSFFLALCEALNISTAPSNSGSK